MSRKKAVCLKDGCLWMDGGICGRKCQHQRKLKRGTPLDLEPPPKLGGQKDRIAWVAWFKRSWRELRRFYGRG